MHALKYRPYGYEAAVVDPQQDVVDDDDEPPEGVPVAEPYPDESSNVSTVASRAGKCCVKGCLAGGLCVACGFLVLFILAIEGALARYLYS